jgi:hypothetical protein
MRSGKLILVFVLQFFILPVRLFASGESVFADESVFIQTDREVYVSGENLFFKLYIVDKNTHKLSVISKVAYVVLRDSESRPIANICMKITNGMGYGNIYLHDTLATGPYQLVAFTSWMRNQGEASYYYQELFIANLFDRALSSLPVSEKSEPGNGNRLQPQPQNQDSPILLVGTDKPGYLKNEKVRLKIALKDPSPGNACNLSVSVSEMLPGSYFSRYKDSTHLVIPDPKTVNLYSKTGYLPEIKGRIIQGMVLDPETHKNQSHVRIVLSAIDTVVNLQYTVTDSTGFFRFLLNDYYNNKEFVIAIPDEPAGNRLRVVLDDKFKLNNTFQPSLFHPDANFRSYIKQSQDIVFVQKNYGLNPKISEQKPVEQKNAVPLIYYKPNTTVYPADYVPLPDFIEISRELLPTLKTRKTADSYSMELVDLKRQGFFSAKPAVFLNGVMITDFSQLIPFGSNRIKRIETVNLQAVKGSFVFEGGILAIFTKEKEIRNNQINPDAIHKILEPYLPASTLLISQRTNLQPNANPDFRQLLYWNPEISISGSENHEIEFPASEYKATYCIKIEGITNNGEIIHATSIISIY